MNIAASTTKAAVAFARAAATSLSIMIYNNPVDYKIEVTLDMFESLKECANIQAEKNLPEMFLM